MSDADSAAAGLPRQCAIVVRPELLADVAGRPALSWLIREAQRWGIDDFVLLTRSGDPSPLEAASTSLPRAARVQVSEAPARSGTGGALNRACEKLARRFVLVRGTAFPGLLGEALAAFARDGNRVDGRLLLRPADEMRGLVSVRLAGDRVAGLSPGTGPGLVDGLVALLERYAVDGAEDDSSFERAILPGLAARGGLRATVAQRWVDAAEPPPDRPALLLGWRGVLREKIGTAPEGWTRGAVQAVRRATAAGWHVFAVTDQPVAALARTIQAGGGTIDDAGPDAGALLRAWGVDPRRCTSVGGSQGPDAPEGAAPRRFLGGDLDALVADLLRDGDARG
jgi:D-glycero-D-manno-heptose 1,7-bisphosphate phosphatase